MPYYNFGEIVRRKREELGLSQEDLAQGICSSGTLSRIENGSQIPTRNHFERLNQRLCIPMDISLLATTSEVLSYIRVKNEIKRLLYQGNLNEIRTIWPRFLELSKQFAEDTDDRQFIEIVDTVINREKYTNEERKQRYIKALKYTCPNYTEDAIPTVLSTDEAIGIIGISICEFDNEGDSQEGAIWNITKLQQHYENDVFDFESTAGLRFLIATTLSKFYLSAKAYDLCLEISNKYLRIAKENGYCGNMFNLMKIQSSAYYKRRSPGDRERNIELYGQIVHLSKIMRTD